MALFEVHQLCKHYHSGKPFEVRALDNLNFAIEQGSVNVLTGPSGSGKTTLLAILAGLERPTCGSVLFEGNSLIECSELELTRYRRRTGFVFQDYALIPGLTAEENVIYPLIAHGWPRRKRRQRARDWLGRLGLSKKLSTPAVLLSGGEQQRVAIARALGGDPAVIFADEPTSNLDPETAQLVLTTIKEVCASGKTLFLSSHDHVVLDMATEVFELEKGTLKSHFGAGRNVSNLT